MLRWRTLIFIILPITILIPIVAWASFSFQQRALRQTVSEREERAVRTAATAISNQISQRSLLIANLATQAVPQDDPTQLLEGNSVLLAQFDGGIAIFDTYNNLLAVNGNEPSAVADWPSQIVPPNNISEVIRDPLTNEPLVLITAPASTRDLIIIGAVSPSTITSLVVGNVLQPEENTTVFVFSNTGQPLYAYGNLDPLILEQYTQKMIPSANTNNVDNNYVVAASPIESLNWTLVTQEPWQGVVDLRFNANFILPLVIVPVLLFVMAALWFGENQIIQPLQQLAQRATDLGSGNFSTIENEVGGISAIRQLQSELIDMNHKLSTTQQNMQTLVNTLTLGQEEERRRLARELHDDTVQSLIALNQRIQMAQMMPNGSYPLQLDQMQNIVADMIADMRRFTQALRPIGLEELGLMPALDLMIRNNTESHDISAELVTIGEPTRLPLTAEFALYRIVQEAVTNVIRHACATQIIVSLDFHPKELFVTVEDDGEGFNVPVSSFKMAQDGHFGLLGIAERAQMIGASWQINSSRETGTALAIHYPIPDDV